MQFCLCFLLGRAKRWFGFGFTPVSDWDVLSRSMFTQDSQGGRLTCANRIKFHQPCNLCSHLAQKDPGLAALPFHQLSQLVKSVSKGREHLALLLRWLRTKHLKKEPLTVQPQAGGVETLFPSSFVLGFFFLSGREFESPWAGKGEKEEGCCKNGTGGGSSAFHSPAYIRLLYHTTPICFAARCWRRRRTDECCFCVERQNAAVLWWN